MTFTSIDSVWWQYFFILFAGWFATDMWRYMGVYFGGRIREDSDAIVFVRCVATALVAAVIGNLIVFPSGELAATPMWLRIGAAAAGFGVYLYAGRNILLSIIVAEIVLLTGIFAGF